MELNAEREQITSSNNDLYKYVRRIIESVKYKGNLDHDDVPTILREFAKGYEQRIKELTEENERLIDAGFDTADFAIKKIRDAKSDTVRKMQERLKDKSSHICTVNGTEEVVDVWWIDQIAKEMLEGKK